MITVQVKKNQIVAVKSKLEPMTSGSQNVYPVQFVFSSEWAYLEKVAVFATELGKDGPGSSVFNVLIDENDRCFVPWEVNLTHNNHVYVGVYGTMNGNVILPTAWADLGNIVLGVTTGLDSEPPTPDIHDQILSKLSDIKSDVTKYKNDTKDQIDKSQAELRDIITKYQTDVTNYINKYQADTTAMVTKYQNDTTELFNATVKRIRDDAFGQIAAIRNIVDNFIDSGLQIINGATIVNKDQFPDKVVPVDNDGDGVIDGNMPISKFPRVFILTNTTLASNAAETSRSWSFANEPVYVREEIYIDEHDNPIPALYVTDMLGKTYAFLTDETGNFNDMVEIVDAPIKYEDIVGTPDISDVTRLKVIAITLKADNWIQTIDTEAATETETLPPTITQVIRMWGVSATQRDQLIIPVPREDYEDAYYNSDIKMIGQDLNTLYFRANNGMPDKDLIVYIYIFNATTYQWIQPPEPSDNDGCCCPDYEFEQGLIEEEPDEEGKVVVRVNTVDDFTEESKLNLPMSAKGVMEIVGNIERLLNSL